jgi:hypothetical protein
MIGDRALNILEESHMRLELSSRFLAYQHQTCLEEN